MIEHTQNPRSVSTLKWLVPSEIPFLVAFLNTAIVCILFANFLVCAQLS